MCSAWFLSFPLITSIIILDFPTPDKNFVISKILWGRSPIKSLFSVEVEACWWDGVMVYYGSENYCNNIDLFAHLHAII